MTYPLTRPDGSTYGAPLDPPDEEEARHAVEDDPYPEDWYV